MGETIYLQIGNISNHIGTHFWNTQEGYFTYDLGKDDAEPSDAYVDRDISFREGVSPHGEATYCPRVLVFDKKENFGTLSKYNDIYPDQVGVDADGDALIGHSRTGPTFEHRQPPILKSLYHQFLDEQAENRDEGDHQAWKAKHEIAKPSPVTLQSRYWSDFSRVYYMPRSIHKVAELPDTEATQNTWAYGESLFQRYDVENSLMDGDVRSFVEECDLLQGFHTTFDSSPFAAFSTAFLEALHDEFPKTSLLTYPVLSDPTSDNPDETLSILIRDALCLRALDSLSTLSVPLKNPNLMPSTLGDGLLKYDPCNLYHTSAILSAHIESATLPLRLKSTNETLHDLCTQLNWRQNQKFSHIRGVLPYTDTINLNKPGAFYDFTATTPSITPDTAIDVDSERLVARRNVTRGLSAKQAQIAEAYFASASANLREPFQSTVHAPAYPLPDSYPNIFTEASHVNVGARGRGASACALTSLVCTPGTARWLKTYAEAVDTCVRTKRRVGVGIELEDLKELASDLWTIHDGYEDHEADEEMDNADDDDDD